MSDLAHRLSLNQIRDGDRIDLCATEQERAALIERLGLLSLDRLEAHAALARDGQKVRATGRLCYPSGNRAVTALGHLYRDARYRQRRSRG